MLRLWLFKCLSSIVYLLAKSFKATLFRFGFITFELRRLQWLQDPYRLPFTYTISLSGTFHYSFLIIEHFCTFWDSHTGLTKNLFLKLPCSLAAVLLERSLPTGVRLDHSHFLTSGIVLIWISSHFTFYILEMTRYLVSWWLIKSGSFLQTNSLTHDVASRSSPSPAPVLAVLWSGDLRSAALSSRDLRTLCAHCVLNVHDSHARAASVRRCTNVRSTRSLSDDCGAVLPLITGLQCFASCRVVFGRSPKQHW